MEAPGESTGLPKAILPVSGTVGIWKQAAHLEGFVLNTRLNHLFLSPPLKGWVSMRLHIKYLQMALFLRFSVNSK